MHPKVKEDAIALLKDKVQRQQRGVPTYFDNWLQRCLEFKGNDARMAAASQAAVGEFLRLSGQTRFQHRNDRHAATQGRAAIPFIALIQSQGVSRVQEWKRLPLFKSVFDLAIYHHLLAEVRPRYILELGSGSGGSAIWLRDIASVLYGDADVVSVDVSAPALSEPRIRFVEGDCTKPESIAAILESVPRDGPVLIIEDAHHGVATMLQLLGEWMKPGDYLVVEDSQGKQDLIAASPFATGRAFAVDTRYVDLFGTNVTSCIDSIFVRLAS